jgi:cytochrome P450
MSLTERRPTTDYFSTANTEPWEFYASLLDEGAIVWDERMEAWLVTSYTVGSNLLRDEKAFRHPATRAPRDSVFYQLEGPAFPFFFDGEVHLRMHQWWRRLFSPAAAEEWRTNIVRPMTHRIVDGFAGNGEVELVDDYIEKIPVRAIAAIMELPWEDDDWIAHMKEQMDVEQRFWNEANSTHGGKAADEERRRQVETEALAARREMERMVMPYVEARRSGTGEDLISRVWRDGADLLPEWGVPEVLSTLGMLLFGGTDTTTHTISNAFYMLLTDERSSAQLREGGDETLARFGDEALRLHGAIHFVTRQACEDIEIEGVTIGKDQTVLVLVLAADRDTERFPAGSGLDLDGASQRHLAFSHGPRYCGGVPLARVVVQESVRTAIVRLPGLRLDEAKPGPSYSGFLMRSYRPLHAVFTPMPGSSG